MSNTRVIGIDFGTSTSVVRIKRYDDKKVPLVDKLTTQSVVFNMGSTMVPTLIRKYDGGAYYGYDAVNNKKNTVLYQNFKVDLESDNPTKKTEARELTAEFFEYLGKVYREQRDNGHLGSLDEKEKTYVSYPVKWSDDTKKFMVSCAQKAGFANVEGIDEAQAAIQAVLTQNEELINKKGLLSSSQSLNILLLDMGAGTTDLVVCKYDLKHKNSDILCTWPKDGSILFGGKEADELLQKYIEAKLPENEAPMIIKRLNIDKFKSWKETVVSPMLANNETVTEFSDLDNILDIMGIEMDSLNLNRTEFENMSNAYLRKLPMLIRGCMKAPGVSASDIDLVILTGGHSQWYFVKEMLAGKMNYLGETNLSKIQKDPSQILSTSLPQETVALGMTFIPLQINIQTKRSNDGGHQSNNATRTTRKLKHMEAKAATCVECGNIEYWYDEVTNEYYADVNAAKKLSKSQITVPSLGHSFGNYYNEKKCLRCGMVFENDEDQEDYYDIELSTIIEAFEQLGLNPLDINSDEAKKSMADLQDNFDKNNIPISVEEECFWYSQRADWSLTNTNINYIWLLSSGICVLSNGSYSWISWKQFASGIISKDFYGTFSFKYNVYCSIDNNEKILIVPYSSQPNCVEILQKLQDKFRGKGKKKKKKEAMQCHSFEMYIEDKYTISGRGTVVTGRIAKGDITTNDYVFIDGSLYPIKVLGIEKNGKLWEHANQGEAVGLLLDPQADYVQVGNTIYK